jgi:hypothetical protein
MKTKIRQFSRLLYQFGWADDGELWWMDNAKDAFRHWVLFHVAVVEREDFKGLSLIIGKASLIVGLV